ncbi:MAG: mechanosensitive ion channel [Firmicutes bacterium]|jgi:small conductance mechanosensitive channel|nr:mechanosensitive ion channel [Bacillota bacterium]
MSLNGSGLQGIYAIVLASGWKLLWSLVVFVVGKRLIQYLINVIGASMDRHHFDESLHTFLIPAIRLSMYIILTIVIASMLGIEMASVIALLASAGLAVGLALQGSLANLAGGVLIMALRPFKVGDFIEAAGYSGTIEQIQIFHTYLRTPDNRRVIIPNAQLSNSSAINYSTNPTRRLSLTFTTSYSDDIGRVKELLTRIVQSHPLVLADPRPQIVIGEHGPNGLVYFVRVWVDRTNYWSVNFDLLEKVKIEFDQAGIEIPFTQMDVHVRNSSTM